MQEFIWNSRYVCKNAVSIMAETKKVRAEIQYAEYAGKWGFGIDILDDSEGYYWGSARAIGRADCVYSGRHEAIRAGLQYIMMKWSKRDHPEIRRVIAELTGMIRQIERPQLSLF